MVAPAGERFAPPTITWRQPLALDPAPELGPGFDPQRFGVGIDLVMAGAADAERLRGSRWHVFGVVAREGRVLYVAR
ncbi:hypothetical protein KBY58_06170 [Cyanobium sp. HWJ4-Hawea]|uniref:hypothetical protein n=1 Tax=Cyanobium sp. HWJ4-Hawea TaxID=2823713 RepID=UPI0020CEDD3E|nr:hypothetical protein [Cyanobium sp. HWJ4-Hawea]MCP9809014.1 hypothetical protein [Cyanobium sp. HWJ4-Hawea]